MSTLPAPHCIRVVLLDQRTLIRSALRALLERQPHLVVTAEAVPGPDAVLVVTEHQPDIILLNLTPQAQELELIPALLTAADHARLLVVIEPWDREMPRQAVHLGAAGVVRTDQPPKVLLTAIAKVHAGELWADRRVLAQVLVDIVQRRVHGHPDPERVKLARLTEREREVITVLGQGLPNLQIAARLSITQDTVRHHLTSIFQKLEVDDRVALLVYAYRYGLAPFPA